MKAMRVTQKGAGSGGINILQVMFLLAGALAIILGPAACDSGNKAGQPSGDGPQLSFKETEHNFGTINYSQQTQYQWAFTNTGKAPLEIKDVRAEPLDPTS